MPWKFCNIINNQGFIFCPCGSANSSSFLYPCARNLVIINGSKEDQYEQLLPQLRGLLQGEDDLIANLANIAAALHQQFKWLWTGFYLVKENELVLGPFQGPVACTRIQKGRGVCGTAWAENKTLIVDDVAKFPGHIACSALSKSEIVIPIIVRGNVAAVLDADSENLSHFDETDKNYLEEMVQYLSVKWNTGWNSLLSVFPIP